MLYCLRPRVFRERIARASGSRASGAVLTPRSRIALTAGFIVAAAGALLIGPNLKVLAESEDSASFWRAEYARKAAHRPQAAPVGPAHVVPRQDVRRDRLSPQVSAYAPAPKARPDAQPRDPFTFFTQPGGPNVSLSGRAPTGERATSKRAMKRDHHEATPRPAASNLVCVRLCDGFFFPAPTGMSATDAGCAAACPNAPTRLYSMRTDRISDAVAARDGAPYARLPVALHYTRAREQTCSCGAADPRSAIMADTSLRRGDRFMTERGFLIYQGGSRKQISRRDFKSLAETRGMPRGERALLAAMERVSVPRAQQFAGGVATGTHVALGAPTPTVSIAIR